MEIYVYLWLIRVDIWQKPTHHYKPIIFQLKIIFLNVVYNGILLSLKKEILTHAKT